MNEPKSKKELSEQYRNHLGVVGFGGSDESPRVYTLDETVGENFPVKELNGHPIKFVVTGEITALEGSSSR